MANCALAARLVVTKVAWLCVVDRFFPFFMQAGGLYKKYLTEGVYIIPLLRVALGQGFFLSLDWSRVVAVVVFRVVPFLRFTPAGDYFFLNP